MKQRMLCVFFLLTAILLCLQTASAELVDRVVAVVNDEIITLSELDEEAEGIFQKIAASVPSEQVPNELAMARAQILDTLIDKRLIAQKAKEKNIEVSDAEVDKALQDVLQRTGMSMDDLKAKLIESGISMGVYRTTLQSQLLQNKLVGSEVHSKIIITDEMILDYYDVNYTSRVDEGAYYLLQIGLNLPSEGDEQSSREETRNRAERVHTLALSGQNFRELAKKFSDLPSSIDGGDIGTFVPDDMAEYMKSAVVNLKPDEISRIVETPDGYQFFKLLSVGDGEIVMKAPYESVKDEIKTLLFDQEMKKAYREWVINLKQDAYIQKL